MKIIITENQFDRLISDRKEKKQEEFISKSQNIHKDSDGNPLYDYSLVDYDSAQSKVKIICPRHKEEWKQYTGNEYFEMTPNHHLSGRGCKFDYLEKKVKYTDKDIEDSAKNYNTASEFKKMAPHHFNAALKRGREFYDKITSHFVSEVESYGEKLVSKILVDNGLIEPKCLDSKNCINREKTFEDCRNSNEGKYCRSLRFDFYIPEYNAIVEYDGEQHFRPGNKFGIKKYETLLKNDKIKNDYCFKNGIKLIRIHYKFPADKIEESLMNALNDSEPITFLGNYPNTEK